MQKIFQPINQTRPQKKGGENKYNKTKKETFKTNTLCEVEIAEHFHVATSSDVTGFGLRMSMLAEMKLM